MTPESLKNNTEFMELRELSCQLGKDPLQVQGAGGNTSLKVNDTMWIKASGTWLMHADTDDLFVPVKTESLLTAMEAGDPQAEKGLAFVVDKLNPSGLRPSIETTVHAVLPQRVVVHVHCVDTIALAVQIDGEKLLGSLLDKFRWVWIPYTRPGLPLSQAIVQKLKTDTEILVLGNHGLVVAADTVSEAASLLKNVRDAVQQSARTLATPDLDKLSSFINDSDYDLPVSVTSHAVACDAISLAFADKGSLYPDHVIFLGESIITAAKDENATQVVKRLEQAGSCSPMSIAVPGAGVVLHKDANDSQQAMAQCLSNVCARITQGASVNYLNEQQTYELLNWEAEQYRQSLNQ